MKESSESPVQVSGSWQQQTVQQAMSRFLNRNALVETSLAGSNPQGGHNSGSSGSNTSSNHSAPMHLGLNTGNGYSAQASNIYFNAWSRVSGLDYEDNRDGQSSGNAAAAEVGFDVLPNEMFLFGVTARVDKMSNDSAVTGLAADSKGWMIGTYASVRLPFKAYLDGRIAWGKANHDADLPGGSTADFVTDRTHASARLSTSFKAGTVSLRPSAKVNHVWQRQQSYSDSQGLFVDEQSMTFGRASFGTDVAYEHRFAAGDSIEAYVGLYGLWTYNSTGEQIAVANVFSEHPWQGRVEVGSTYNTPNGMALRGVAAYEGLGVSDFDAVQGSVSLIVPLN